WEIPSGTALEFYSSCLLMKVGSWNLALTCWTVFSRQRTKVERGISRHKRRLGFALTARSEPTQHRELLMRTFTHKMMVLAEINRKGFNRAKTASSKLIISKMQKSFF